MRVGFVGWRGMVGSVLMERMTVEKDFDLIESVFFSTSSPGAAAPRLGKGDPVLRDANDIAALKGCDTIITCQGGDYTKEVYPQLRAAGWTGYWVDAASTLRMADDAVLILDPVNMPVIRKALAAGTRNYIGGNCTVSLMMLAIDGLLKEDLVEWVTAMTYQAASGAGAPNMRELLAQMGHVHAMTRELLADPQSAILDIDRKVNEALRGPGLPRQEFGLPLAGSLIPWIADDMGNGVSKEEWKGGAECNKILGRPPMGQPGSVVVEGLCVRIGAMRCHSQALTIKLKRDLPMGDIERMIGTANRWVKLVPNTKEASIRDLSPAAVSGTMDIPIGRLRKLAMGSGPHGGEYLAAFTVGDQLLWGAAEPLRRMLRILLDRLV
jgi:aspartate-semialdehyde dehydrogenase